MSSSVLIFRKRLLAYSETFIVDQGRNLPGLQAVFVGFRESRTGRKMLGDLPSCVQAHHSLIPAVSRLRSSVGLGANARWLRALRSHSPLVLHAHFGTSGVSALPIARQLDVPLLTTFHGYDITREDVSSAYGRARSALFREGDAVIAISDFVHRKLLERGCPAAKIHRHYIGVDTAFFSGEKVEEESPTVLFVGRLVSQKGCRELLQAMKTVWESIPMARVQVVGEGPLLQSLQDEFGDTPRVSFLGPKTREEVRDLMLRAWVLCNPSLSTGDGATEGLGMVFLEAQAVGTPAVSFDTGGVVEAIDHGKTGYTVGAMDIGALSDALITLMRDDRLREAMGEAGKVRVRERFNLANQCSSLKRIYDSLV